MTNDVIVNLAKNINQQLQNDNGIIITKVYESQLEKTKILIIKYTDLLAEDRNIDLIMNKIDELRK